MKAIAFRPVLFVSQPTDFGLAGRSRRQNPAGRVLFGGAARRARDNPRFPRGSEVSAH